MRSYTQNECNETPRDWYKYFRLWIYDVALAATLKEYGISGIYTANVDDFASFDFLEVINPLNL